MLRLVESGRTSSEHLEEQAQVTFFEWAQTYRVQEGGYVGDYAYMVPNGVFLQGPPLQRVKQMRRLKAAGFMPGVADIVVPLARGEWHHLYIEAKRPRVHPLTGDLLGSKVSEAQMTFGMRMAKAGNLWVVAYGVDELIQTTVEYLGFPEQSDV